MAQIMKPGQTRAGTEGQDNRVAGTTMGALQGAGTGAMIGSAVPGIGTAIGAGIGAALGGGASYAMENAKKTEDTPDQREAPQQIDDKGDGGAMGRRLEQLNSTSRLSQLRDSIGAIPQLPPEQRQQYAEPLMKGYMQEIDSAVSKGYLKRPGGMA